MTRPVPSLPGRSRLLLAVGAMLGPLVLLAPGPTQAQELTKEQIIEKLAPKPRTRSMGQPRTRRIEVVPGSQDTVLKETADLPAVSVRILFGYDSDALTPDGESALRPLGEALKDPKLQKSRLLLGGHTDATGSPAYNQELSERRARSVREHLIVRYGLSPERLVSMGFGLRKPADPANPTGAVNRRVEVVNLGDS